MLVVIKRIEFQVGSTLIKFVLRKKGTFRNKNLAISEIRHQILLAKKFIMKLMNVFKKWPKDYNSKKKI